MRACVWVIVLAASASTAHAQQSVTIPDVPAGEPRLITADDFARRRLIETLSVSPDGSRFAISVRQGDPVANNYRRGWFIGSAQGGSLTFVGDGGDVRLARTLPGGRSAGALERPVVRWSPDGRAIAYTALHDGAMQLWRSDVNGRSQQQLTHNAADVGSFEWSDDSRSLYFLVGAPRAEQRQREIERERAGYRYDQDVRFFTDLWLPQMQIPEPRPASTAWVVTSNGRDERLATDLERAAFERAKARGVRELTDALRSTLLYKRSMTKVGVPG